MLAVESPNSINGASWRIISGDFSMPAIMSTGSLNASRLHFASRTGRLQAKDGDEEEPKKTTPPDGTPCKVVGADGAEANGIYQKGECLISNINVAVEVEDVKKEAILFYDFFVNGKPECAKLANSIGLRKVLDDARFINPMKDKKLLGTKLKDLGATGGDKNITLQEAIGSDLAYAHTIWETQTVYFATTEGSASEFSEAVFHELLHIYAKGNHVEIAKKLGLEYKGEPTVSLEEQKKADEERALGNTNYKPKTIENEDDLVAKRSLSAFLERECKK